MMLEDEARAKLRRYITATERVFRVMEASPPADESLRRSFEENVSLSRLYLGDSKYYLEKGDLITAIVCIAYCEGLIDACKTLGWLKYEWAFGEGSQVR